MCTVVLVIVTVLYIIIHNTLISIYPYNFLTVLQSSLIILYNKTQRRMSKGILYMHINYTYIYIYA